MAYIAEEECDLKGNFKWGKEKTRLREQVVQ